MDTGLNLVHVDDVAKGHFLALERGVIGERYILGGENLSLQQMLADIAGLAGRKPPTIKLPRGPLYPLAAAAELFAKFSGKEPFVTIDGLRMSKNKMYFTSAKAERELGYSARPYGEGLKSRARLVPRKRLSEPLIATASSCVLSAPTRILLQHVARRRVRSG